MKKMLFVCLFITSTSCLADTVVFKVTQNNPNNYGEESIQLKTNKGPLSIYSVNLSQKSYTTLASLKKGQCIAITSPDKITKYDNYYAIDQITSVKKATCSK